MTTPMTEQPEDVRGRPAAWTLAGMIGGVAASIVVVWLLLGLDAHGGGRSNPREPIALPTSQPFVAHTPLEERRTAQERALDAWLPAEIDRYVATHGGQP